MFPEEDKAMRQVRSPQPDMFKTLPPYELPSPKRTRAVELLKVLLAEVFMSAVQVGNGGNDNQELDNE
jgi:hypothetical protein